MATYSLIKDGTVINIIISDADFVSSYAQENGFTYVNHDEFPLASIGATTTDNVTFHPIVNFTAPLAPELGPAE